MKNIYKECPSFETGHFFIRIVQLEDAESLVGCYSDGKSQELFNADNCTGDFHIHTTANMRACLSAWLRAYEQQEYIRFAIVDKTLHIAVGTIEMFGGEIGILRIDIKSSYEEEPCLNEIVDTCIHNFYDLFSVKTIATKAVEKAQNRIKVLREAGFCPGDFDGRENYYLRSR
jgi:hypothetical protein